ncbi:MAG: D-aminoacyl-tRNA deacylase [Moraxellaceae bacterium]|nr:D-aminoacyl-tRNA deacylase [Moraxellaceae bacterium]
MIALIQRVRHASVSVAGEEIGRIGPGLLAFVGVQREDDEARSKRLLERVLTYRVFGDDAGRMNRSLRDTDGGLLLISQFTLAADTRSGTRASFTAAAEPARAQALFDQFVAQARATHADVACGRFGADMQVSLLNDGPVTFWLEA